MKLEVHHHCEDFTTYRAARVKSLFNAESGCNFDLSVELPLEDQPWQLGVIVGPSGSGKSSLGELVLGPDAFYRPQDWPADAPIVDAIAPEGGFNDVTAALAAVGLGDVPSWLRPYPVLSTGEKFRADLARIVAEAPARVVVDEFTSTIDRQIAKIGALAFQKAWRRTGGQAVLLTCHHDVLEWLEPDWIYDTGARRFARDRLQRPRIELEVWETDWRYWPLFEPHHYLKAGPMPAARCYVGTVDGAPVAHLGMASANRGGVAEARACRLVIMPEWQGAGIGMRFLNQVCELQLRGEGHLRGRPVTTIFHTSHPGLCAALRRDRHWRQVSAALHGVNRRESARTQAKANAFAPGYGGHFRAVQGFRFYGDAGVAAVAS
ncbi:MAG: ABC transporter ATP-binding protein [Candidatus Dormibacteraeota bacterium]|nr:ABC transporter ATP-binding protein [Candidatus Dormibacteraeota bacterium]